MVGNEKPTVASRLFVPVFPDCQFVLRCAGPVDAREDAASGGAHDRTFVHIREHCLKDLKAAIAAGYPVLAHADFCVNPQLKV